MVHLSTKTLDDDLRVIGLATERCHAIPGSLVRLHFRLSSSPPLGWSYIFTTVWRTVQYPLKRPAGVEGDFIWIDCVPEEVGLHHLAKLEESVAKANAEFRAKAQQQALNAGRQAQLDAKLRSQIADLNRTLYPEAEPATRSNARQRSWISRLFAKFWSSLTRIYALTI